MTRDYCTYFDRRYLARALLLHRSLRQHDPNARLWALCMDAASHEALSSMSLPGMRPIALSDFEAGDERLVAAKESRSIIEYYFTCTPSLPRWVLKQDDSIESITYLDADLYFFASPDPIFAELGGGSVGIIEHRFPEGTEEQLAYGIYNVGLLMFRNDATGREVLEWWRDRCLEWCYDRVEDGRYADQRYLDDWPARFDGVRVLRHPGANVAPWNLARHRLTLAGGALMSDLQPLICYHFHAVKQYVPGVYDLNFAAYGVRPDRTIMRRLYRPYLRALRQTSRAVAEALPVSEAGAGLRPTGTESGTGIRRYLRAIKGVATRRLVVA